MKLRRFAIPRRHGVVAVVAAALVATAAAPLGAVATTGSEPAPATSSVRDWNLNALNALVKPTDAPEPGAGQTPPVTLLHMAMVHGAIYDAVNAIDGGYQSYLPDVGPARRRPRWTPPSPPPPTMCSSGWDHRPPLPEAVVTRLDGLYEEALAAIPDGADKTDGIAAGPTPRRRCWRREPTTVATCRSRTPSAINQASGVQPARRDQRPVRLGCQRRTVPGRQLVTVPHGWAEPARQRRVHHRVQRGQGPRRHRREGRDPEQQALADFYNVHAAELFNRTLRTVAEAEGLSVADEATVRHGQPDRRRHDHHLLGREGVLALLASDHRHPRGRQRRQRRHGRRPDMGANAADAAVSGPRLRLQLRLVGIHVRRGRLLRRGTKRVQRRQDRARRTGRDPRLRAVHGRRRRHHRRPSVPGPPLPAADVQGAEIGANVAEWSPRTTPAQAPAPIRRLGASSLRWI